MQKIFHHTFEDTIWSIGYWGNAANPTIWIETRNPTGNTWHHVGLQAHALITSHSTPKESLQWLAGLQDGGVFIQLRQGKNPGIERLLCFDFPSGHLRYSIELTQWTSLEGEILRTQAGIIDLNTGRKAEEFEQNPSKWNIESPMHIEESQPEFKPFARLFEVKFDEKIGKGIDYWEGSNKLIFSYYIYENTWKNKLRICDFDFQTLFSDTIAEGEQMGYQTFQRLEDALLFIKDKRELLIYEDL